MSSDTNMTAEKSTEPKTLPKDARVCPLLLIGKSREELRNIKEAIKRGDKEVLWVLSCFEECGWFDKATGACSLCYPPLLTMNVMDLEYEGKE